MAIVHNKPGQKGFQGKNNSATTDPNQDILSQGFKKIDADLDIHDRERNPIGGLHEGSDKQGDMVDYDNDYDEDGEEFFDDGSKSRK